MGSVLGYYVVQKKRPRFNGKPATGAHFRMDALPEQVKKTRSVDGHDYGLHLTMFQYQTCPFCCKVRAFLNYYGIPHDIVEVNPVMRKELGWSDYKKVPTVITQSGKTLHQLNDSSTIISSLLSLLVNKEVTLNEIHTYYPSIEVTDDDGVGNYIIANQYRVMYGEGATEHDMEKIESERMFRIWADRSFVHLLSPNVYRTPSEALETFRWFSKAGHWDEIFSDWERLFVIYVGAAAMYVIGKRLKKRHMLKEDVRQSLYDGCNVWLKQLKKGGPFHGGKHPDLADLAIYGMLSSIEGCQAFQDLTNNTKIINWYSAMKLEVNQHRGASLIRKSR